MYDRYEFLLKPLPYTYDALEPFIDTRTMHLHHDQHLKTYVDNLNKILSPYPLYQRWTLERLVRDWEQLPGDIRIPVRNNAGGVYNHNLFFDVMGPHANVLKPGKLQEAILRSFGSSDDFKTAFKKSALAQFGSGYAWLAVDQRTQLRIVNTPNQDTILPMYLRPVLLLDVWEHAYYLKYQNRRAEYIDNWFEVIDWDSVQANYEYMLWGHTL